MSRKAASELDRMIEMQSESEKIRVILDSMISKLETNPVESGEARKIFQKYEDGISEKISLSKMLSEMREE